MFVLYGYLIQVLTLSLPYLNMASCFKVINILLFCLIVLLKWYPVLMLNT